MTTPQYLAAIKRLGLTPAAQKTARVLGLSIRQLIRISNGDSPVPTPVAKLLFMLERHGIPKDWR